jgi:hypothetical protein
MAQATLVEMQVREGQRLIDRLAQAGVEITAAAWVRESESGDWYLYLATPLVEEDGATRPAYRRVNSVIREMLKEGFGMDPFQKKVIGPHDSIAKDLIANRGGRPGGSPTPFGGGWLGDLAVEEAYIYPPQPTREEAIGIQLWAYGGIPLTPGIGQLGLCRVVIIDIERQVAVQDRRYRGTMQDHISLPETQIEATWAEGGALRIVGHEMVSKVSKRWRWSQRLVSWEEGGCPPDKIVQAILAATE